MVMVMVITAITAIIKLDTKQRPSLGFPATASKEWAYFKNDPRWFPLITRSSAEVELTLRKQILHSYARTYYIRVKSYAQYLCQYNKILRKSTALLKNIAIYRNYIF